jgi:hypothetical protein
MSQPFTQQGTLAQRDIDRARRPPAHDGSAGRAMLPAVEPEEPDVGRLHQLEEMIPTVVSVRRASHSTL